MSTYEFSCHCGAVTVKATADPLRMLCVFWSPLASSSETDHGAFLGFQNACSLATAGAIRALLLRGGSIRRSLDVDRVLTSPKPPNFGCVDASGHRNSVSFNMFLLNLYLATLFRL